MLTPRHKKSHLAAPKDLSELDAAVKELSERTAALVGKAQPARSAKTKNHTKPVMPTHRSKLSHKPKSFDIIHQPRPRRQASTLKTAPKLVDAESSSSLAPDHMLEATASLSYNETSQDSSAVAQTTKVPEIQKHHSAPVVVRDTNESANTSTLDPTTQTSDTGEREQDRAATARQSLNFSTEQATADEHSDSVAHDPTQDSNPKLSGDRTSSQEKPSDLPAPKAVVATGELYANNLVDTTQSSVHTPEITTQSPKVFDTTEYHPELHDWSTLEHRHRWPILAAVVFAAIGALIIVLLSTQTIQI